MSNVSKGSPIEGRRPPRRKDEVAHDLEALVSELAESRQAIVHLLALAAGADEVAALDGGRAPVTPLRAVRSQVTPGGQAVPAIAAGEDQDGLEGSQSSVAGATSDDQDGRESQVPAGRAGALTGAQRRLLAIILVAIGAVVLLTTLVSLL